MITAILCVILICFLFVTLDIRSKIRIRRLRDKMNACCKKTNQRHVFLIRLEEQAKAKWSAFPLDHTQETQRARELNNIWDNIRQVEEVRTRNAKCQEALHNMTQAYPALNFSEPNNKLLLDLVARDVDIQGWSIDTLCGHHSGYESGFTTQWW